MSSDTKIAARIGTKTFKGLLLATLGVASVEGIAYSFTYFFSVPGCGAVLMLSLGVLLLSPLATLITGLTIINKVNLVRWFFGGLVLIALQVTLVGFQIWQLIEQIPSF